MNDSTSPIQKLDHSHWIFNLSINELTNFCTNAGLFSDAELNILSSEIFEFSSSQSTSQAVNFINFLKQLFLHSNKKSAQAEKESENPILPSLEDIQSRVYNFALIYSPDDQGKNFDYSNFIVQPKDILSPNSTPFQNFDNKKIKDSGIQLISSSSDTEDSFKDFRKLKSSFSTFETGLKDSIRKDILDHTESAYQILEYLDKKSATSPIIPKSDVTFLEQLQKRIPKKSKLGSHKTKKLGKLKNKVAENKNKVEEVSKKLAILRKSLENNTENPEVGTSNLAENSRENNNFDSISKKQSDKISDKNSDLGLHLNIELPKSTENNFSNNNSNIPEISEINTETSSISASASSMADNQENNNFEMNTVRPSTYSDALNDDIDDFL